jgi:hypothetical protein
LRLPKPATSSNAILDVPIQFTISCINLAFQDCQFAQCGWDAIYVAPSYSVQLFNDLFTGCGAVLGGNNSITLSAENITADSPGAFVDSGCTQSWSGAITDSILCNCDDSINYFTQDHVTVTSYVPWQTSWLGDHYLPADSDYLANGSTTADQVGLYWYTTRTDQVPEGTSVVARGYHYRATDSNGNPLDDNGDGANWNPLCITTQPASQSVTQGTSVTFSVAATGTAP